MMSIAARLCASVLIVSLSTQAVAGAVVLRAADHADYSRVVFEWPAAVEYSVTSSGERATVTFRSADTIDLARLKGFGLKNLRDPRLVREGDRTTLSFSIPVNGRLHHYRSGGKIVLDVKDGVPQARAADKVAAITPGAGNDTFVRDQLKAVKAAASAPKPPPPKSAAEINKAVVEEALQSASVEVARGGAVTGKVEPINGGIALRYTFTEMVPAAIFARGNQLVMAWPGERVVTTPPLEAISGDRARRVDRLSISGATVLSVQIRPGIGVGVQREGTTWKIEIKDSEILPRELIRLDSQSDPVMGSRVFGHLSEPSRAIQIADPLDGKALLVVPAAAASAGVMADKPYPGGTVLASAQGLVVKPSSARVQAVTFANGVALMGLEQARSTDVAQRGYLNRGDGTVADARLIDLAAWQGRAATPYTERKAKLLYDLSMASEVDRAERRWALARFYLGNGMAADAAGVLDVMAQSDPDILNAPAFRATRGVARLQLRQFAEAYDDLGQPVLDTEPEMALWRSMALEAMGRPGEAVTAFATGDDVIALYDPEMQARFRLAAVRADIANGGGAVAAQELAALDDKALSPGIRAEVAYWQGKLALAKGDQAGAAAQFATAASLADRRVTAMATLAMTQQELSQKKIGNAQAIDRLDRLRFAWRGDDFELDLLDELARLYLDGGELRDALYAMRQSVKYFKPSDRTRAVAERMDAVFRNLFLDGGADTLPPVQALGLYYDFRDLTPMGADGDAMIRKLVERLVSVDLLDRAASLLEHQVKYRLEGIPQAAVAARLAMIHLMNAAPDKAIGVLRATRQQTLPDDIRRERNQVEARALLDLGQADEAEVVLEGDRSPAAQMLRADVYWKLKDWKRLAAVLNTVLPAAGETLDEDGRRLVLRAAVARTMLSDEAGLAALRRTYRTPMGRDALGAAFDVITTDTSSGVDNIAQLSATLAEIDKIDAFVRTYREAFAPDPAPAAARPARTAAAATGAAG
ncbi:hypothetical protein [Parapedomonas caeni]